jgi:hypothetical protein
MERVPVVDDRKLDELREHFDAADLTDSVDTAVWETDVDTDPMIVTSVRLPKSLLDWVRERAAAEQVKPTALIRRWIEERQDASAVTPTADSVTTVAQLADRVSRLETFAVRVATSDPPVDTGSMTDLLSALEASIEAARGKPRSSTSDQERRGA